MRDHFPKQGESLVLINFNTNKQTMNLSEFLPLNQISRELSIYINSPTNKKPIKAIHIKELIENYINSYDDIYNIRKEIAENAIDHANEVYDKTEKLD